MAGPCSIQQRFFKFKFALHLFFLWPAISLPLSTGGVCAEHLPGLQTSLEETTQIGAARFEDSLYGRRESATNIGNVIFQVRDQAPLPENDFWDVSSYSSWTICPDSTIADVSLSSAGKVPPSNVTESHRVWGLRRDVVHGRQCLISVLNAYSHSKRKNDELEGRYQAILQEKETLEELIRGKEQGRVWGILEGILGTLAGLGLIYYLPLKRGWRNRDMLGLFWTAMGFRQPRSSRPLSSAKAAFCLQSLWGKGGDRDQGSGALFVQSHSDARQLFLLVPVNLGSGRPFALFGTGGDHEADLEKAEAYVGERPLTNLSIILYKHGGFLFDPEELNRVEGEYGSVCSVVGRTTRVPVLLMTSSQQAPGFQLRGSSPSYSSSSLVQLSASDTWPSFFLRDSLYGIAESS